MRQERREVLAVPLYPEPHASFVDEYQTYNWAWFHRNRSTMKLSISHEPDVHSKTRYFQKRQTLQLYPALIDFIHAEQPLIFCGLFPAANKA